MVPPQRHRNEKDFHIFLSNSAGKTFCFQPHSCSRQLFSTFIITILENDVRQLLSEISQQPARSVIPERRHEIWGRRLLMLPDFGSAAWEAPSNWVVKEFRQSSRFSLSWLSKILKLEVVDLSGTVEQKYLQEGSCSEKSISNQSCLLKLLLEQTAHARRDVSQNQARKALLRSYNLDKDPCSHTTTENKWIWTKQAFLSSLGISRGFHAFGVTLLAPLSWAKFKNRPEKEAKTSTSN